MRYALVKEGKIIDRVEKKDIYIKDVNPAHRLSDDKLANYGWLPIVRNSPTKDGEIIDYKIVISATKVNENPIVKVDDAPTKEIWERAIRGDEVDHGDWIEQTYTVKEIPLDEYKKSKKKNLISNFSMKSDQVYSPTIQRLVALQALDKTTIKEVEDYYKIEGKKLEDALKLVDSATTHLEVSNVSIAE